MKHNLTEILARCFTGVCGGERTQGREQLRELLREGVAAVAVAALLLTALVAKGS